MVDDDEIESGMPFLHVGPIIDTYIPDPQYEHTLNTNQMKACVPAQPEQSPTL